MREKKAATTKRIANLKTNMGRRATPVDNNDISIEEEEELSREDVANSVFGKQCVW